MFFTVKCSVLATLASWASAPGAAPTHLTRTYMELPEATQHTSTAVAMQHAPRDGHWASRQHATHHAPTRPRAIAASRKINHLTLYGVST